MKKESSSEETWIERDGARKCPICDLMTVYITRNGGWACENDGDLRGYQCCQRCNNLYKGIGPFCSKACENQSQGGE